MSSKLECGVSTNDEGSIFEDNDVNANSAKMAKKVAQDFNDSVKVNFTTNLDKKPNFNNTETVADEAVEPEKKTNGFNKPKDDLSKSEKAAARKKARVSRELSGLMIGTKNFSPAKRRLRSRPSTSMNEDDVQES